MTIEARVREIDLLRGFAIVGVVALHVSWFYAKATGFRSPASEWLLAAHLASGYGVPLFVALSGAMLSLHHARPGSLREHAGFLLDRAARLLPAYVTWSLVSAWLFRPATFRSVAGPLRMLVSGSADAQFYFLPLLFEIYLLWPLLRPLAHFTQSSVLRAWTVGVAGVAVSVGWWHVTADVPAVRSAVFAPLMWLGYLAVGAAVAPHIAGVRRSAAHATAWLAALASTILSGLWMHNSFATLAPNAVDERTFALAVMIFQLPALAYTLSLLALLALVACRASAHRIADAFVLLGTHSYGVFLVHLIVLRLALLPLLAPEAIDTRATLIAKAALCWLLCLLISTAIVALGSRSRWTRALVTNRR
jgi:peptidoglycan/LPS O-acetylase OafA/YrhL